MNATKEARRTSWSSRAYPWASTCYLQRTRIQSLTKNNAQMVPTPFILRPPRWWDRKMRSFRLVVEWMGPLPVQYSHHQTQIRCDHSLSFYSQVRISSAPPPFRAFFNPFLLKPFSDICDGRAPLFAICPLYPKVCRPFSSCNLSKRFSFCTSSRFFRWKAAPADSS